MRVARVGLLLLVSTLLASAPSFAQQVAVGTGHTLALDKNGRVFAWGSDSVGQLGSGQRLYFETPRAIAGLPPIQAISARHQWVVALDRDGNVWNWGLYVAGERSQPLAATPGRVLGLSNVVRVSAGYYGALVVRGNGETWGWGSLTAAGFGPVARVPALDGVVSMSVGVAEAVGVRQDGSVLQLGGQSMGQLVAGAAPNLNTALPVQGLPPMTLALTDDGEGFAGLDQSGGVWVWGCWTYQPCKQSKLGAPRKVAPPPGKVVSLQADPNYVHAVLDTGEVWTVNPTAAMYSGTALTFVRTHVFTQSSGIAVSSGLVLSLRGDGLIDSIGGNQAGQLGIGQVTAERSTPQRVILASNIVAVAAGQFIGYALKQDGSVLGWGQDYSGSISGIGRFAQTVPRLLTLPLGTTVSRIASGARSGFAVSVDGSLHGWGENAHTNLGLADITATSSVTLLPISNVADVDGGVSWTVVIKKDGTVWRNSGPSIPELGTNAPGFASVAGISNARRVFVPKHLDQNAPGADPAFILDAAGTLYGTGWDIFDAGLFGERIATTYNRPPAPIPGISRPVIDFSIAYKHAAALLDDGTVWTWGLNESGQLGDGTTAARVQPRQVVGLSGVVRVSAGRCHTLALKADGTVWAWGCNSTGQLGDGTTNAALIPRQVPRLDGIVAIRAGFFTSYAARSGGLLFAWGALGYANDFTGGMLGDGTAVSRKEPVLVLRENGLGNADREDWFLDLDPAAANNRPAFTSRTLTTNTAFAQNNGAATLNAAVIPRFADLGKAAGIYVVARVQPDFLAKVNAEPEPGTVAHAIVEKAKAKAQPIVVNLSPTGWVTVTGQLVAVSTGVLNTVSGLANILASVKISGGSFCIGYGDSATGMLAAGTLGEVLNLDGAVSTSSGPPCLLPGLYVGGPTASRLGTPVTFTASVIGGFPAGSVQLKDWSQNLGGSLALVARNEAVATASLTTSSMVAGVHSIAGNYSGDSQNEAATVATPLLHQVSAAPAGSVTELIGPVSSGVGDRVIFVARVVGDNPTGSVRLQDGGVALVAAAELIEGRAAIQLDSLSLGAHSISATYGGDTRNVSNASNVVAHTVVSTLSTKAVLGTTPNPSLSGTEVTLTATVIGNNPTGTVVFREGAAAIATATLAGGKAIANVSGLTPGVHLLSVEYGGDANNTRVTSETLAQQVTAPATSSLPNAFSFSVRNNVVPGSNVTSNSITVTGITARVPVVVSGGSYSMGCGATFTEAPGLAGAGDTVCVRHSASSVLGESTYTTLTVGGVSATFTSTTYPRSMKDGVALLVARYYQSILGRGADAAGQAYWEGEALRLAALDANVSEAFYALASAFFASPEYLAARRTHATYVGDLYRAFFGREPDTSGLNYWVGLLEAGLPREVALSAFMFSAEFSSTMRSIFGNTSVRAEVDIAFDLYRGLLARLPDSAGLVYWLAQLRIAQCTGAQAVQSVVDSISSQFATSPEYAGRNRSNTDYVSDLYNAFLRRGGDLEGVLYWIGQLDRATRTREQVRKEFLVSPEFSNRVQGVVSQGCAQ